MTYSNVQGGATGTGNINSTPGFVYAIRLASGSAGRSAGQATAAIELDGEGRDSTPDIGIDEYVDTDSDGLPDWWEIRYGSNPNASDENGNSTSDATEDWDGDGDSAATEYANGTNPGRAPLGSSGLPNLRTLTPFQ